MNKRITALSALFVGAFSSTVCQAIEYTLTVLPDLPGNVQSSGITQNFATGINDAGQIVGYSNGSQYPAAVIWNAATPTAPPVALSNAPGTNGSFAFAINNAGQVAGTTGVGAVSWTNGVPTVLSNAPGTDSSVANAINSSGQVAGYAHSLTGNVGVAVLWNGTTPTVLQDAGQGSTALAINSSGQVAGITFDPTTNLTRAVLWNGSMPTLLNNAAGMGNSYGVAINDSGVVAGITYLNGQETPVVWIGGSPTLLPAVSPLDLYDYTVATGINDLGQIVGYEHTMTDGSWHALLWTPDSSVTPAVAPLPPTWTMMLIGLAGFGAFTYRARATPAIRAV